MRHSIITTIIIIFINQSLYSQESIQSPDIQKIEESGNYQEALFQAKKMLEQDSLNISLLIETARLYKLNQQYKNSIATYQRALKLDPANQKITIALARINNLTGTKAIAIKLYNEVLKSEPTNIMALTDLAEIYSSTKQSDSAVVYYKKLYRLDTLNVEYLYKLAFNQWSTIDMMESFANYKKALAIDSSYLPVVLDLARIYTMTKLHDSAIIILKRNINVYPEESRIYAELGSVYFALGEHDSAIPWFEKGIKLGYTGNEAYKRLATSYYSIKEFEKSKTYFEILFDKDSNDYKTCLYLGNLNNILGNPSRGLELLERAIWLITPDPMTITTLYSGIADSHKLLGNHKEQINAILKRQEYLPDSYKSEKYLQEIAEIYEYKLKDKPNALKYYEKYYAEIKNLEWLSQQAKNTIASKIKNLKTDIEKK